MLLFKNRISQFFTYTTTGLILGLIGTLHIAFFYKETLSNPYVYQGKYYFALVNPKNLDLYLGLIIISVGIIFSLIDQCLDIYRKKKVVYFALFLKVFSISFFIHYIFIELLTRRIHLWNIFIHKYLYNELIPWKNSYSDLYFLFYYFYIFVLILLFTYLIIIKQKSIMNKKLLNYILALIALVILFLSIKVGKSFSQIFTDVTVGIGALLAGLGGGVAFWEWVKKK